MEFSNCWRYDMNFPTIFWELLKEKCWKDVLFFFSWSSFHVSSYFKYKQLRGDLMYYKSRHWGTSETCQELKIGEERNVRSFSVFVHVLLVLNSLISFTTLLCYKKYFSLIMASLSLGNERKKKFLNFVFSLWRGKSRNYMSWKDEIVQIARWNIFFVLFICVDGDENVSQLIDESRDKFL